MNNRKISDLTVSEFKTMMEEMFNAHDPIYQQNKRAFDYENRRYQGKNQAQSHGIEVTPMNSINGTQYGGNRNY